jgi:hypothetical protein
VRNRSDALRWYLVLVLIIAVVVAAFWKTTTSRSFYYDEADYMYAGTRGFVANYLDQPSISVFEFVRKGLELSRDKTQRSNISQFVRSSGDITFYRHYHGPVYAYWLALWHSFGVEDAGVYRASGLIIHLVSATLIFWMFGLAFPAAPPIAAFVAALSFVLNRAALISSTMVTQHVMYTLTAGLALFFAALFFRTRDRRFWYAACAALGLSFATVESSFILVAAFLILLLPLCLELGWRQGLGLLGRGALVFVLAILIVWPKGVLQLGVLKGYGYLGYMAIFRKAFTPIGPMELWGHYLTHYPEEFVVPLAALILSGIFWKRMPNRQALLPFVVYGFLFIAVTMVITNPFPYYHVSLLMATAVITGVVFGWLWTAGNFAARAVMALAVAIPLLWMPLRYYGEAEALKQVRDSRVELFAWLNSGDRSGATLVVPYTLVPTLHFYHPQIGAIGYDVDASPATLAADLLRPNSTLLCEEALCQAVRAQLPGPAQTGGNPVMGASPELQTGPLFALETRPADQPPNR